MIKRLMLKTGKRPSLLKVAVKALMFAAGLGLYGCMPINIEPVVPPVDLVWPRGGETPRIRFVDSISRPGDLHITESPLVRLWKYMIGKEDDSLVTPYGVTVDSAGRLYVVDTFQRRIQLFDISAGEFAVFPAEDRPMTSPVGIAVDNNGRIYVADSQDSLIKVFDNTGDTSLATIGNGLLQRPTGIAVNQARNELLVVDTKLDQVFRFDLDNRRLKGTFGARGGGAGQFNHPTHIAVAGDGTLLVTDALNFRIQIFSSQGVPRGALGSAGDSPGHFSRPRGVASDSDGNVYVVDALFDNVQMFDKTSRLLMDFGSRGREHGQFWLPAGIWIDRNDKIYVADSYNGRVQIFQYLKQEESLR
jgi:DNA-binding beta-propeller fold protein YncE